MKIDGSTILVTGASSGIGAALAPMLAARGATVGIVARRKDRLEEVLARCVEHAPGSRLWAADLGDLDAAERVAREAWDAFDGVDCLVNNAAIPKRTPVQRLTREEVDTVMRVNFTSPVRMTFALLPDWLARDSGMRRERLVDGRSHRDRARSRVLRVEVRTVRVERVDGDRSPRHRRRGQARAARARSRPRSGTCPTTTRRSTTGRSSPPDECAASIVDAIEGDGFEYYVPPEFPGGLGKQHDMVIGKTTNPDAFIDAMGQMARP